MRVVSKKGRRHEERKRRREKFTKDGGKEAGPSMDNYCLSWTLFTCISWRKGAC